MTSVFYYQNTDLGNRRVRLGSIASITQAAERGVVSTSSIELDDPNGDLDLPPFFSFLWNEDAASQPLVFLGYGSLRSYQRVSSEGLIVGPERRVTLQVEDVNAQLNFRVINHNTVGYKRPAEDDYHRIDWLITNGHLVAADNGLIDRNPLTNVSMSAVDYTGQTPDQVLQDCSDLSGKNYFLYLDPTTGERSLAYFKSDDASFYPSGLFISSDPGDLGNADTYVPLRDPVLTRDPEQTYNGAMMDYSGGTIYLQHGTNLPLVRDVIIPSANTSSKTHATALVNKYLAASAFERETVTCTIQMPAANVNDLAQGMLVTATFPQFPGWESGLDVRVLSRSISTEMSQDFYNVELTIGHPKLVSFAGGQVPDNTKVWPSQQPPFTPGDTNGYVPTVINDGAIHAWKYDEASGDALDYVGTLDLTIAVTGANPTTRQVAGPPLIIGATDYELTRSDTNGQVHATAPNDGADFPSGNQSWTWEWWGDYISTFLDDALWIQWGDLNQTIIKIGGSAGPTTALTLGVSSVSISTTTGSLDISAYTGVGYHDFMLTYDGSGRLYTLYVDGVNRWTGTGNVDAITDVPSGAGQTWPFFFNALQTFRFGWESLYPTALTAAQAANHALGDGAVSDQSFPAIGQPVAPESAIADGSRVIYQTNYPYVPGSLVVKVNGIILANVDETDPDTGIFTLPAPPAVGAVITWTYNVADPAPTGANNPSPGSSGGSVPPDPGTMPGGDGIQRQPLAPFVPAETPNGVITVFTIAPYVAGTTLVTINGLYQRLTTDYTESSPGTGAITFTSAPWTGADIVIYAMPYHAVSTGPRPFPAPVTTGTFVIPGSIDDTGATDVVAAMNAWIESVPDGSILQFGGGTFQMSQGIQLSNRHNLELDGQGATIIVSAGSSGASQLSSQIITGHKYGGSFSLGATDIQIHDFVLTGNNPSPGVFTPGTEAAANLELTGCTRLEVFNVTGSAAWGDFIFVEDITNGWFHDNTGTDAGRNGISVISGNTILCETTAFITCGYNTLDVEPNDSSQACVNITIRNTSAGTWGNAYLGVEGSHTGAPIHGVIITGNSITTDSLLTIVDNGGTSRMTNIAFTNNSSAGGSVAGPVLQFSHVDGVTVTGNVQTHTGALTSFTDCTNVTT